MVRHSPSVNFAWLDKQPFDFEVVPCSCVQVSQPYMWDERFLRAALQRYKCFLHILRKSEGKILCVPTYDIDLMWHSHQVGEILSRLFAPNFSSYQLFCL